MEADALSIFSSSGRFYKALRRRKLVWHLRITQLLRILSRFILYHHFYDTVLHLKEFSVLSNLLNYKILAVSMFSQPYGKFCHLGLCLSNSREMIEYRKCVVFVKNSSILADMQFQLMIVLKYWISLI